jgi:hypothetical protein
MLLQAMLGLQQDAPRGKLYVDPRAAGLAAGRDTDGSAVGVGGGSISASGGTERTHSSKFWPASAARLSGGALRCPQARQGDDKGAGVTGQRDAHSRLSALPFAFLPSICTQNRRSAFSLTG